jgi:hypothetical protein
VSTITRDQFLRGIAAINAYRGLVSAIDEVVRATEGGTFTGLGSDGLLNELTHQLEERCGDPSDADGSMIEYMLYECGGPVVEANGDSRMVNTPELLWTYWEETLSGPFTPANTTRPPDPENTGGGKA